MTWGIVINNNFMGRPHHCGHNNLFNMMMTYNFFQSSMNSLIPQQPIQQPVQQATSRICCMPAAQSVFAMPQVQRNPFAQSYNTNIQLPTQNLGSETYQNLIESDYFQKLLNSQPSQSFYPYMNLSSFTNPNFNNSVNTKTNGTKPSVSFSDNAANVNSRYNGSAEDLNKKLAKRGVLAGKGATFLKAQEEYGVNAAFLAAICINESGGTSNYAKNKNNVGGVRCLGSKEFRTFSSVDECIMYMAKLLKNHYINKGYTTIAKVGAKYCPTSDPTDKAGTNGKWASRVTDIYNNLV